MNLKDKKWTGPEEVAGVKHWDRPRDQETESSISKAIFCGDELIGFACTSGNQKGFECRLKKDLMLKRHALMKSAPILLSALDGMLEVFAGDCEDLETVITARSATAQAKGFKE